MNITITKIDLFELLKNVKGTTAVSFVSVTEKKIAGRDLQKISKVSAFIGIIFGNSVNKAKVKAGETPDHVSQPRKWGERLSGTPLVRHKDFYYLESKVQHIDAAYTDLNGNLVEIKEEKPTAPVVLRDYSLSSIKELKLGGDTFIIK